MADRHIHVHLYGDGFEENKHPRGADGQFGHTAEHAELAKHGFQRDPAHPGSGKGQELYKHPTKSGVKAVLGNSLGGTTQWSHKPREFAPASTGYGHASLKESLEKHHGKPTG